MTQTRRLRLERRQGWQGAGMARRDLDERGLKPSLVTTTAKASERVIADPLGWEREGGPARLGRRPWRGERGWGSLTTFDW